MFDFQGKTVLVTGGAKGVGKVTARKFVEHGATVVIDYFHSYEAARQTQAELSELGGKVHLVRASVAKKPQVDRMFAEVDQLVGGIDILINNAASGALVPHEDLEQKHWDRAFDTNFKGSLWCAENAARMMAARGGGAIVNLSSLGSDYVVDNYMSVGVSKATVEALTRYLAVEFAPSNIRVNAASCSLIDNDVARMFPQAEEMYRMADITPMGRMATEADLANVVLFLASDLSSWITGQTIVADGGLTLRGPFVPTSEKPIGARFAAIAEHPVQTTAPSEPQVPPTDSMAERLPEPDIPDDDRIIAVVGMGMIVPGANSPEEFWTLRDRGKVTLGEPGDRWDIDSYYAADPELEDRTYSRKGGFISDPGQFSADPTEEYTTTWLHSALRQAIDGVAKREDDRWTFAVGYTADGSQHLEEALVAAGLRTRMDELSPKLRGELDAMIGQALPRAGRLAADYLPHVVGRKAMKGLLPEGTKPVMVDTACSSSLYAVDIGIRNLLSGASDVAACGGAFGLSPRGSILFSKLQGLSKSGHVRSLDEGNDGALFSDGAAVVVLKTLRRARADGDRVLGILAGVGGSSDGKGKAIYAPNSAGQQIAVQRAQRLAGIKPADIDWIVAHATGTPAGDLAEFDALRTTVKSDRPIYVTSNKSLIGHTGWAAGVVSLIEVLLAFRHERIPPQFEFDRPPKEFDIAQTSLDIPTTAIPWPGGERPRTAAVSGFGFGGTNAHMIVRDKARAGSAIDAVRSDEAVAVVAWSSALPGNPTQDEVSAWIQGSGRSPAAQFGDSYPLPPFSEVRIPPATLRTIDRCQAMILRCVGKLAPQLGEYWSSVRDTTGVVVGHLGPTRNATLYAARCYLNHLTRALAQRPALQQDAGIRDAFESFESTVRSLVPPGNENSFPGIMPNVIASRVSNYYDFHGQNITIDSGFAGGLAAIQHASESLRWGDLDLALVCGINGNSTPELTHILTPSLAEHGEIAEGAFMVALVRESTAQAAGLPILGSLSEPTRDVDAEINCDPSKVERTYLAGDGVKALIESLARPESTVAITVADPLTGLTTGTTVCLPKRSAGPSGDEANVQEDAPDIVHRHVVRLVPQPLEKVNTTVLDIDTNTMVLTDNDQLAHQLVQRGAMVVCTDPDVRESANIHHVGLLSETTFEQLPPGWTHRVEHLRVVSALPDPVNGATESTLRLHDATFLVLKTLHSQLSARRGSCAVLLLSSVVEGTPHPSAGLFAGLIKSALLEMPEVRTYAVITSTARLDIALGQLAAESTARQMLPVVVYDGDSRQTFVPIPEPISSPEEIRLGRSSVVVAIGAGRGITAECAVALAANSSAKFWVLGSNPLDTDATGALISDAGPGRERAKFISTGKQRNPGISVAELNTQYDRIVQARTVQGNLGRIAAHSGADRVRYLTCDLNDPAAVLRAVETIQAEDGRIDLLLYGAGLHRGTALEDKGLAEFRRIRDIKVRGYDRLRHAFIEAGMALPAMWCNFGSLAGFVGQNGEADYSSGNEFLSFAAAYANSVRGQDEVTIGWTLWQDIGLAADPVTASFMERAGIFSAMTSKEGVEHFLRELRLPRRYPAVVQIGDTERVTIDARAPGMLALADSMSSAPQFFLDRRLVDEPERIVAERVLDLTTDSYLADHVVNGVPTLPGTFVTALVADAALALLPGWKIVAMSDVVFKKFLRVYPGGTGTEFRVVAEACPDLDGERSVVVRVVSDVRAPNGRMLRRDQVHFEATAHLRKERPAAPYMRIAPATQGTRVPDPYHLPNEAVHLTGSLVSTIETRVHSGGASAVFSLPRERRHAAYECFSVPAVLMDGLARVSVLTLDRYAPLVAPLSIARIEFYDDRNDAELADAFPNGLDLYSINGSGIEHDNGVEELGAIGPDGRLLLRMTGVRGIVIGYVDVESGEFLTPQQIKQRVPSSSSYNRPDVSTVAGVSNWND